MRRFRRPPPQKFLTGREFSRLMSALVMLGVLWMMATRAGDPDTWRWLASDPDGGKKTTRQPEEPSEPSAPLAGTPEEKSDAKSQAGESPAAENAAGKPNPPAVAASGPQDDEKIVTGPTDADEEEWDAAREEFQAISDKGPLTIEEMQSYWRMVRWSQAQTFDEMRRRAKRVTFTELWEDAPKYRGKPILLPLLHLRQVIKWEATKNAADVKEVYEARGWTEDSKSFIDIVVFCDKPPKLPVGIDIYEESTFVGYFLKLMEYYDGLGVRRAAPLLIGRIRWNENVARTTLRENRNQAASFWPVIIGGVLVLAVVVVGWVFKARFPRKRPELAPTPTEAHAVESWIENIGQDKPEDDFLAPRGRTNSADSRETDAKALDWTDPGLHDETFPGHREDSN